MKSTPARVLISMLIAVSLAGCGQTGALYLPKQPVKPDSPTGKPGVAPPSAPVPATPPASQQ
ncbi:LPS translocon maturation chaperone LptM [Pseudoduganella umbonata]|uniref:LPS translocon maturation chaperone LptM n=1 Tax=Pseudoduganella umbonata TaxID=864828 RepID=UPI001C310CCF